MYIGYHKLLFHLIKMVFKYWLSLQPTACMKNVTNSIYTISELGHTRQTFT